MSDNILYEGARFYRCALQVNPASYAQHRGEIPQDETEYNRQILEQCRANKIEVVGLADHGQIESSESLRQFLQENEIIVFPGFEIASSEKIHMVCLYLEGKNTSELNQYLGQLMGNNSSELTHNPTHPSSLSCEQIAQQVLNSQGGFWYAAHMTGQNGLLKLSGAGDNYAHLWKKDDLVFAGQIPGTIECLAVEQDQLKGYRDIIENKNPDYRRDKPIAIVNAKDVAKPEDLANKSASCLIKMTKPTFDAFKQAFYDPKSRIRLNYEIPEKPYSVIRSIQWQGASFFGELGMAFSENLNAVIGGRGTGKSTLIESIRYVLDLPVRRNNSKALESFRKNTLSDSQIILNVSSKAQHGNCYTISRRYGEQPVVKNDQNNVSRLTPNDILPDIELLGQNEILEIEQDESAKLSLINNFIPNSSKFDADMATIKRKLIVNKNRLIRENEEFEQLNQAVSEENKLKEKVAQFNSLGITGKLKNTKLLEKEKTIQAKIKGQFGLAQKWLKDYQEIFDLVFLQDTYLEQLPNRASIAKTRKIIEDLQKAFTNMVEQANKELQKAENSYQTVQLTWQESSNKIRDALNKAIAQLPEQAGKSGANLGREYTAIIEKLAQIEQQKGAHKDQQKLVETIELERNNLLEEYRNTAFEHFNATNKAIKKLNKGDLKGKVKVSIVRCGNLQPLKDFLLEIDGIGLTKIQWLDSSDIELDLVQWAKWIEDRDVESFMNEYKLHGMTRGIADRLLSLNLKKRLELQEIELQDRIDIELNTAHEDKEAHYAPLDKLSTGQKCTAILNLLLLSCDDPLIIDQPEDNLDNAFIAERIVQDLRQFKTSRQFLFATHNANIPVFGDAELIAVLDSTKDKGAIEHQGSIDKPEVREQAAEILEGGEAAFNMRKNKYGF